MSDLGTRRTPYSIPDGTEPYPEDRVSWALEQVDHLGMSETLLLTFLARHAWGRDSDDGRAPMGYVRDEWSSTRRIAETINKSKSAVSRMLGTLRENGYISVRRGDDPSATSSIKIWWYEKDDQMREAVRDELIAIPRIFTHTLTAEG